MHKAMFGLSPREVRGYAAVLQARRGPPGAQPTVPAPAKAAGKPKPPTKAQQVRRALLRYLDLGGRL